MFRITVKSRYSATLTERSRQSVNRNCLLYSTSIFRHPRYSATNCGEQTVALYSGLILYIGIYTLCSIYYMYFTYFNFILATSAPLHVLRVARVPHLFNSCYGSARGKQLGRLQSGAEWRVEERNSACARNLTSIFQNLASH
jgi:hypothetical protein